MSIDNPSKNLVPGGQLIADGDMSADITSTKICDIERAKCAGVQLYAASADHVGTIAIQESIDGDNWVAVEFADGSTSITVSASAALSELKNLDGLGGRYMRIAYTRTSGSGTLQAYVLPKRGI